VVRRVLLHSEIFGGVAFRLKCGPYVTIFEIMVLMGLLE